ncbi:mucin-5AC-like [Diprion similis]|uniref:mucin-5AC-like n=1 Tax=Diprion similis TaxID=362088 RepID=UPI001EF926AE|nr:mucin-5AC-like [Diprion similis]
MRKIKGRIVPFCVLLFTTFWPNGTLAAPSYCPQWLAPYMNSNPSSLASTDSSVIEKQQLLNQAKLLLNQLSSSNPTSNVPSIIAASAYKTSTNSASNDQVTVLLQNLITQLGDINSNSLSVANPPSTSLAISSATINALTVQYNDVKSLVSSCMNQSSASVVNTALDALYETITNIVTGQLRNAELPNLCSKAIALNGELEATGAPSDVTGAVTDWITSLTLALTGQSKISLLAICSTLNDLETSVVTVLQNDNTEKLQNLLSNLVDAVVNAIVSGGGSGCNIIDVVQRYVASIRQAIQEDANVRTAKIYNSIMNFEEELYNVLIQSDPTADVVSSQILPSDTTDLETLESEYLVDIGQLAKSIFGDNTKLVKLAIQIFLDLAKLQDPSTQDEPTSEDTGETTLSTLQKVDDLLRSVNETSQRNPVGAFELLFALLSNTPQDDVLIILDALDPAPSITSDQVPLYNATVVVSNGENFIIKEHLLELKDSNGNVLKSVRSGTYKFMDPNTKISWSGAFGVQNETVDTDSDGITVYKRFGLCTTYLPQATSDFSTAPRVKRRAYFTLQETVVTGTSDDGSPTRNDRGTYTLMDPVTGASVSGTFVIENSITQSLPDGTKEIIKSGVLAVDDSDSASSSDILATVGIGSYSLASHHIYKEPDNNGNLGTGFFDIIDPETGKYQLGTTMIQQMTSITNPDGSIDTTTNAVLYVDGDEDAVGENVVFKEHTTYVTDPFGQTSPVTTGKFNRTNPTTGVTISDTYVVQNIITTNNPDGTKDIIKFNKLSSNIIATLSNSSSTPISDWPTTTSGSSHATSGSPNAPSDSSDTSSDTSDLTSNSSELPSDWSDPTSDPSDSTEIVRDLITVLPSLIKEIKSGLTTITSGSLTSTSDPPTSTSDSSDPTITSGSPTSTSDPPTSTSDPLTSTSDPLTSTSDSSDPSSDLSDSASDPSDPTEIVRDLITVLPSLIKEIKSGLTTITSGSPTSTSDPPTSTSDPLTSTSDPLTSTSDSSDPSSDLSDSASDPSDPTEIVRDLITVLPSLIKEIKSGLTTITSGSPTSTSDPPTSTSDPLTSTSDPLTSTSDSSDPSSDLSDSASDPSDPTEIVRDLIKVLPSLIKKIESGLTNQTDPDSKSTSQYSVYNATSIVGDGTPFIIHKNVTPLLDDAGNVINQIVMGTCYFLNPQTNEAWSGNFEVEKVLTQNTASGMTNISEMGWVDVYPMDDSLCNLNVNVRGYFTIIDQINSAIDVNGFLTTNEAGTYSLKDSTTGDLKSGSFIVENSVSKTNIDGTIETVKSGFLSVNEPGTTSPKQPSPEKNNGYILFTNKIFPVADSDGNYGTGVYNMKDPENDVSTSGTYVIQDIVTINNTDGSVNSTMTGVIHPDGSNPDPATVGSMIPYIASGSSFTINDHLVSVTDSNGGVSTTGNGKLIYLNPKTDEVESLNYVISNIVSMEDTDHSTKILKFAQFPIDNSTASAIDDLTASLTELIETLKVPVNILSNSTNDSTVDTVDPPTIMIDGAAFILDQHVVLQLDSEGNIVNLTQTGRFSFTDPVTNVSWSGNVEVDEYSATSSTPGVIDVIESGTLTINLPDDASGGTTSTSDPAYFEIQDHVSVVVEDSGAFTATENGTYTLTNPKTGSSVTGSFVIETSVSKNNSDGSIDKIKSGTMYVTKFCSTSPAAEPTPLSDGGYFLFDDHIFATPRSNGLVGTGVYNIKDPNTNEYTSGTYLIQEASNTNNPDGSVDLKTAGLIYVDSLHSSTNSTSTDPTLAIINGAKFTFDDHLTRVKGDAGELNTVGTGTLTQTDPETGTVRTGTYSIQSANFKTNPDGSQDTIKSGTFRYTNDNDTTPDISVILTSLLSQLSSGLSSNSSSVILQKLISTLKTVETELSQISTAGSISPTDVVLGSTYVRLPRSDVVAALDGQNVLPGDAVAIETKNGDALLATIQDLSSPVTFYLTNLADVTQVFANATRIWTVTEDKFSKPDRAIIDALIESSAMPCDT